MTGLCSAHRVLRGLNGSKSGAVKSVIDCYLNFTYELTLYDNCIKPAWWSVLFCHRLWPASCHENLKE